MISIADLHKLAYTRMPKEQVHLWLHESALALGKSSLKDLTSAELDELAFHVRQLPSRHHRGQAYRQDAYGPRERASHRRTDETLKRPRRGRSGGSDTIKLATPKQRAFAAALAREVGWDESAFATWLRRYFEVESMDQVGTSEQANEIIRRLLRIKGQKARRAWA